MQEILELIKIIPPNAWVAFFTALFTSFLTLMGVKLTNASNHQRLRIQLEHERQLKKEEILRDRIEKLYVEAKKYMIGIFNYFLPYGQVMKGEIDFNQALDMTIDYKANYNPERVLLIMDMYFPEVKSAFAEVEKVRDELNHIIHLFKEDYKRGSFSKVEWYQSFQSGLERFLESSTKFEECVAKIARNT